MNSMPAALQSARSDSLIGREASEICVSPRQNFLKPPPVPEMPTVTRYLPPAEFWNSSAMASVIGKTVLEPSIWIVSCAAVMPAMATTAAPPIPLTA